MKKTTLLTAIALLLLFGLAAPTPALLAAPNEEETREDSGGKDDRSRTAQFLDRMKELRAEGLSTSEAREVLKKEFPEFFGGGAPEKKPQTGTGEEKPERKPVRPIAVRYVERTFGRINVHFPEVWAEAAELIGKKWSKALASIEHAYSFPLAVTPEVVLIEGYSGTRPVRVDVPFGASHITLRCDFFVPPGKYADFKISDIYTDFYVWTHEVCEVSLTLAGKGVGFGKTRFFGDGIANFMAYETCRFIYGPDEFEQHISHPNPYYFLAYVKTRLFDWTYESATSMPAYYYDAALGFFIECERIGGTSAIERMIETYFGTDALFTKDSFLKLIKNCVGKDAREIAREYAVPQGKAKLGATLVPTKDFKIGEGESAETVRGLYISSLYPVLPAYAAGVRPGDVILSLNGKKTLTILDLREALEIADPEGENYVEIVQVSTGMRVRVELVLSPKRL